MSQSFTQIEFPTNIAPKHFLENFTRAIGRKHESREFKFNIILIRMVERICIISETAPLCHTIHMGHSSESPNCHRSVLDRKKRR